ncbi:MAG: right-handed parallel beta-helix repeat-containing protein [Myxococcaceae bacterium]|nr:right-handed parallel beta-helix repeat-containing protein [Myxococcaceae bacterium]
MHYLLLLALTATKEIGPGMDVEAEVALLNPGDELVLRGGLYTLPAGRFGINKTATQAMPIVIRSKDGETAHIRRPNQAENLVDITGRYLVFRNLEFSGGSAGLRFENASFITIEGCNIHDTGDVAIRANDNGVTYDGFRILRNNVHHTNDTGEAMYLGCNANACRFANGLIEGNWVHDTNGATVVQGDGIEIKEGGYNNVIRDNVIHDTKYPCITLYSAVGNAGTPNIVERNVMWRCGNHGVQVTQDARIRNNIILSAVDDGIALQTHAQVTGGTGNVQVINNTVLDSNGDALSIRGATGTITVANNALYSSTGAAIFTNGSTATVTFSNNVGAGGGPMLGAGNLANDFVMANFGGVVPNNVFPKAGGALVDAGTVALVPADDFNGTARLGVADVGAYKFAASNPGWALAAGFKGGAGGGSGAAGGSGGAAGGSGSAAGGSGATAGGAGAAAGGSGSTAGGGSGSTAGGSGSTAGGSSGGGAATEPSGCGCSGGLGALPLLALALFCRRRRL